MKDHKRASQIEIIERSAKDPRPSKQGCILKKHTDTNLDVDLPGTELMCLVFQFPSQRGDL